MVDILEESFPPGQAAQAFAFLTFSANCGPTSAKYCILPSCLPPTNLKPVIKEKKLFIHQQIYFYLLKIIQTFMSNQEKRFFS